MTPEKMRFPKRLGLAALVAAVALAFLFAALPRAHATEYWKKVYERFSATAGESLSTGDVVCIKAADSKAYKADADSSTLRPAVGVVGKGASTSGTVEIVIKGVLAGQTAASPGKHLFLSTTAGAIRTSTGPYEQILGWVMPDPSGTDNSTDYFIDVRPPSSPGRGY